MCTTSRREPPGPSGLTWCVDRPNLIFPSETRSQTSRNATHVVSTTIDYLILENTVPLHVEVRRKWLRHTCVGNTSIHNTSKISETPINGRVPHPHRQHVQLFVFSTLWENVDGPDNMHLNTIHDLALRKCLHDDATPHNGDVCGVLGLLQCNKQLVPHGPDQPLLQRNEPTLCGGQTPHD